MDLTWLAPILTGIPALSFVIATATFVTTSFREWGWKRRKDLRDELRAFSLTNQPTGHTAPKRLTAAAAARVLDLDLAETARSVAERRLRALRRSPHRNAAIAALIGLLMTVIGVSGLILSVGNQPLINPFFGVPYFGLLILLSIGLVVDTVRSWKRKRKANQKALSTIDRGSLSTPIC